MKNYNNSLFNEQIKNLEEDLQEFLNDAEKILGYKVESESYYQIVENLFSKNTEESKVLATDMFETLNDIHILETYKDDFIEDEIFNTLQNEDEDS